MTAKNSNPSDSTGLVPAGEHAVGPSANGAASPAYRDELAGPLGPSPTSGGNPLRRYLSALFRFKWLILAVTLLGGALGFALSRLVSLTYVVQATVWMDPAGGARGPIQEGKLLESASWTDLLKSYTVLDHVVQSERLYLDMEPADRRVFQGFTLKEKFLPGDYRVRASADGRLTLEQRTGSVVETVAAGDSLGRSLGFSWVPRPGTVPAGRNVDFAVRRPRDVARQLSSQLQTRMQKNGSFIQLELRGTDRERLASTLNAVIHRFVDVAAELKRWRLDEFANILGEQLRQTEQNLQSAEYALENFRINTITLPTEAPTPVAPGLNETRSSVMSSFMNLKLEQDAIRRDRDAVRQAVARAGEGGFSVAELETITAVQTSSELKAALSELAKKRGDLRGLQYRYTDEHPDVRKTRGELQTLEREIIPRLVSGLVQEIDRRDRQIDALIGTASGELRDIPPRVMEEARLARQVNIATTLYTTLRQRNEEAQLAALSSSPDLRILDEAAIPDRPVDDQRKQIMLMALLGSLGLAIMGVMVYDQFDPRVRYPEQVTHGLRLPILAAVPRLKSGNGRLGRDLDNTSQVVEAFRELRMRLLQARTNGGAFTTAITSPGSGDGKSFVAVNLALCFAEQGYRTLLIDGDIRRGDIHHFMGRSRHPGLTDVLAKKAELRDALQTTPYPLLDLIASGKRMPTGPELLSSATLSEMLDELRTEYSIIIVDTPPLGAGVDPFVIGTTAKNLLIVLRAGRTDRQFAEAKLEGLDPLPVNILGAVFNGVPEGGVYRYYSYLPGYESPEEAAKPEDQGSMPVLSS